MMRLYSKGCEYVLRVLTHMSRSDIQRGFSVKSVCKKAGVPLPFTRKIFQTLVKNKFLRTKRGPGGGYIFEDCVNQVSVLELIQTVDGKDVFNKCILGKAECRDEDACAIHPIWKKARKLLISELNGLGIKQLICNKQRKDCSEYIVKRRGC